MTNFMFFFFNIEKNGKIIKNTIENKNKNKHFRQK
jgi:hypothetical protein